MFMQGYMFYERVFVVQSEVIKVSNLDLTFEASDGPVHALKNVNLKINKGDFVSFIGPSGCGKTTLGRTILHLEKATKGHIFYRQNDVTNLSKKDLKNNISSEKLIPFVKSGCRKEESPSIFS